MDGGVHGSASWVGGEAMSRSESGGAHLPQVQDAAHRFRLRQREQHEVAAQAFPPVPEGARTPGSGAAALARRPQSGASVPFGRWVLRARLLLFECAHACAARARTACGARVPALDDGRADAGKGKEV